jgi:hypothetical protein
MNRHMSAASAMVLCFAFAGSAHAELRHVEIKTLGMD